jgi:hypothetical protein
MQSSASPRPPRDGVRRMSLRGRRPRPCGAARARFSPIRRLLFADRPAVGVGADLCVPLGGPAGVRSTQLLGRGAGQVGSGAAAPERVAAAAERAERGAAERARRRTRRVVRRPFFGRHARWRGRTRPPPGPIWSCARVRTWWCAARGERRPQRSAACARPSDSACRPGAPPGPCGVPYGYTGTRKSRTELISCLVCCLDIMYCPWERLACHQRASGAYQELRQSACPRFDPSVPNVSSLRYRHDLNDVATRPFL